MALGNNYESTNPIYGEGQYTNNSTPAPKDSAAHQRTYQACIPCRNRKVRCDLGSVDNPDPPCVRCKREIKDCYFSSTRRKKKSVGPGAARDDGNGDTYEVKAGKKRLRASQSIEAEPVYDEDEDDEPRTPGGSVGRAKPLRRPPPPKQQHYTEEDHQAADQTTAMLQTAEVHGGHDALKVLFNASQHVEHSRSGSNPQMQRPTFSTRSPTFGTSPAAERVPPTSYSSLPPTSADETKWKPTKTPNTVNVAATLKTREDIANYNLALKTWSRFRFVRAGWFTAKEGIDYTVYFYKYLSPLTPVCLPDYSSTEYHEKLLTLEPMLAVTILLISTRHMKLEGPGQSSRPYAVHDKLWKYLSGMVQRIVWGQEQFGGGFCGAGAAPANASDGSIPAADVNPLSRKGLRTMGTVESLVLLTEWHPRAMHFPPDEADEELMIPDHPVYTPDVTDTAELSRGIGGQRMDAWLEPCWRSDRMCWMLLGMAMSLAFEIGVFDETDWQRHAKSGNGEPLSEYELKLYDKRRSNIRDIMLIYVTQTSGRLGLTSMLPANYSKPEESPTHDKPLEKHENIQDTTLYFWLRMARLIREGNQTIFANKDFTRDLIKSGKYKAALDQLQGPMLDWRAGFEKATDIPAPMRCVLLIEYEYCRVYINALALQAVAERCANEAPQIPNPPMDVARAVSVNGIRATESYPPNTLSKLLGGDRKYFFAVRDASTSLLKLVVDGLYPGDYLRHAPVRTYFRIISVAIMLLKSFSLGASENDVVDALTLVDRTVEALKSCIVDDVHVASRFAELLSRLTENLKPRFVRVSADGRSAGRSRVVSNHATPAPGPPPVQQPQQYPAVQQQQWNYPTNTNNNYAPANPLLGLPYDLATDNDYAIMPPPSFNTNNNYSPNTMPGASYDTSPYAANGGTGGFDATVGDWLTLPLDGLFNANGPVESSMYGPQIGGSDMLELLLGDAGVGEQQPQQQQGGQNGY